MHPKTAAHRQLSLGIAQIVVSVMHLMIGLFIVFTFGGKGGLSSLPQAGFLWVYDLLGSVGYVLFFAVVVLSFVAGVLLIKGAARARILGLLASVLNLPLLPFGTALGLVGLWTLLRTANR